VCGAADGFGAGTALGVTDATRGATARAGAIGFVARAAGFGAAAAALAVAARGGAPAVALLRRAADC